ncbi:alpha/beta fold hydrolase [Hymenobacter saemangeumensis]|uniref:Alpha/beta fold hydrolase n=1 Tax=Hymenobacter saemangeumensis TaxID=1084522 RepID=A0ABP8I3E6_9BACT
MVFVHGTPTWSFLYRAQIRELSRSHRCIAADNLGFGLSDKPASFDQHPARHADHLQQLLAHLGVTRYTLVVHDFGGPIGLALALRQPERVCRLVLLNTWLWATAPDARARRVDGLLRSWLGRLLYLRFNFSPRVLLRQALARPGELSVAVHRHYLRPFPTPDSRWGLLRLGYQLLGASDWYEEQSRLLPRLRATPALLIWGRHNAFLGAALPRWQQLLPEAQTLELPVGHFPQEEAPAEVGQALRRFLASPPSHLDNRA